MANTNGIVPSDRVYSMATRPVDAVIDNGMVIAHIDPQTGQRIDVMPYPAARTFEQKLGQQNWRTQAGGRVFAPESANADIGNVTPDVFFAASGNVIPSVLTLEGEVSIMRSDYNVLQNMVYLRNALALIDATGRNDQKEYALTGVGGVLSNRTFSSPNLILGFQIEWGIQMYNAQAFNITVETTNFQGANGQIVDRNFQLRVFPSGLAGGIFSFLFANRTSGVSAGYHYDGVGGMNYAIVQPAQLGLLDASIVDAPLLTITVPASMASIVSFVARPIAAATPAAAAIRERTHETLSAIP